MTSTTGRPSRKDAAALEPDYEVVVIGAGPGGIAAGVALKRSGLDSFAILERCDDLGGSWRDNTYPGIGVDVPSIAYQYSFARNSQWTRLFAKGPEVLAYHRRVAEEFGLMPHIHFSTGVEREVWNDKTRRWTLHTTRGVITSRFVISAVGAFLNPKDDPGVPGWQDFAGHTLRPAAWDHSYDLRGKCVAIVGTGASSVQITPAIAEHVATLDVYQRTPVWCLPKPDFALGATTHRLLGIPGVAAGMHGVGLAGVEAALRAIVYTPPAVMKPLMRGFDAGSRAGYRAYLRARVHDPRDRAGLAPSFGPLAKRPTLSNTFLTAFNRPNTHLITTAIDRIEATGVRDVNGTLREVDALILATGYELFSDPESYRPGTVVGRDGFDLGEYYTEHGLQAYESVSLPKLPNRWTLVGPYSWTGTGWHALVEITSAHAVRAISEARRRGATHVEVTQQAHDAYHAALRRRGRNINHYFGELNAGVRTYYVNSQGDMPYIRPSSLLQARRASRHFPLEDYRFDTPTAERQSTQSATQLRAVHR
jgi:cation diffusion facilitator CzcD-associated flavoprotein CzcO